MEFFHILSCFGEGFITGIVLSLMLGTVFFALIRNSISFGYKVGIYIALGVILSDIIFISLALLSHGFAVFLKKYELWISIGGGIVLIIMGIAMFLNSKPKLQEGKHFDKAVNSNFYFISSGFLINVLNPVNFFSWLTISSMLTVKYNYDIPDKIVFFIASLLSIFIVEIGISFSAHKIKKHLSEKTFVLINKISGTIFILFGLKLCLGFLF